tara:strand:- start:239 stop:475 length:237 start_codon:yes stop_codon:yes gene_type:complete
MARGGRTQMAHGGMHNGCGPGMMMTNGGCVSMGGSSGGYQRGGRILQAGGVLNHQSGMPHVGCPAGMVLAADGNCIMG